MKDPLVKIWNDSMKRRERNEIMTDICLFLAHIAGDSDSTKVEKARAQELLDSLKRVGE